MNYSLKEAISKNFNLGKIKGREIIAVLVRVPSAREPPRGRTAIFKEEKSPSNAGIVLRADKNKKLTAWLDKGRKPPRPPR